MTAVGTADAAHCLRSTGYACAVYLNCSGDFPSPPGPLLPEQTVPTAKTWLSPRGRPCAPRNRPAGAAPLEIPNRSGRCCGEMVFPAFFLFSPQPIRKKEECHQNVIYNNFSEIECKGLPLLLPRGESMR